MALSRNYNFDIQKRHKMYGMSNKIIYEGEWLTNKKDKIIIIMKINEEIVEYESDFCLELNNHENIIQTVDYMKNTSNLTIFIQEYAVFNNLSDILIDNKFHISQTILIEILRRIANAMNYVASKRIIHGDLCYSNGLVFRMNSSEPKKCLTCWIDKSPNDEVPKLMPKLYYAPEILRDNHHSSYSEKSDVYSMGVMIWEGSSNGEIPYSSTSINNDMKHRKLNNIPNREI